MRPNCVSTAACAPSPARSRRCAARRTSWRRCVGEPGNRRVLIVDGGASRRCALLGDNIAALAVENGWAGIVINGCVRDAAVLGTLELGVSALATHPRASGKAGAGELAVPVTFGGVTFSPGALVASDEDGLVVIQR